MGHRQVVLGSASPARRGLLRAAGIEPVVRVSGINEEALVADLVSGSTEADAPRPPALALQLARAKAADVARSVTSDPDLGTAIVIGCDSILEWQGQAFGKPESASEAVGRWRAMRSTMGLLHTGHCVIDLATDTESSEVVTTQVWFGELTDSEIDSYVDTGEPLAVAGAFTLDGIGSAFVDRIVGDPSNVIGLSIPWLRRVIAGFGIPWPQLWRRTDPTA
ncbi:MAG: septum formation inhibitor Maf [Candidatus Nanopelagicales bacterium]|nr:septum formation inhibitor Maf [Candidatus Nanopelagicales bacterium]